MWFTVEVRILQNFARFQNLSIFCWSDNYRRIQSCFIVIWVNGPFLAIDRFEKLVLPIEVTQVNDYHYTRNKISLASKSPRGQGPQYDPQFLNPLHFHIWGSRGLKIFGDIFWSILAQVFLYIFLCQSNFIFWLFSTNGRRGFQLAFVEKS